jgi:outer membrane protein assembly factor BamB
MAGLLVALPAWDAYAVVPAVVGPLQALIAIAPQLLALLGAALLALTKPGTYRSGLKFLWHQKIMVTCLVAAVCLLVWGGKQLFGGKVGKLKSGLAWPAMRGGPQRLGAQPGEQGPGKAAKVLWTYAGRGRERVDSSPAVVGNRVYFSSAVLSLFGGSKITGSGTIYCRDTDGGGVVWEYSGKGMGRDLTSVFASPAVGGEITGTKGPDGKPEQGRYLVSGEGYHQDQESRFFCLDLEPTRSGGAPKLKWFKQANSHVESSPCISKCSDGVLRMFVGAGDDGVWAVNVETGEVSWKLEGTPAYYIHKDCAEIDKVRALAGQTVAITGTVERFAATITDPGQVLFTKIEKVEPCEKPPAPFVGEGFRRTVFGKVEEGEIPTVEDPGRVGVRRPLDASSGIMLRTPRVYLDVESSPVAVDFPVDPAQPGGAQRTLLFFGTGLGGRSGVACVDACTGEAVWFKPVPNPVFSAPAVLRGVEIAPGTVTDLVVVGYGEGDFVNVAANPEGTVLVLDLSRMKDGVPEEHCRIKVGDTILGAIAADAGVAYACSRDGALYAVDLAAKSLLRRVPVGSSLVCAPAVTEDSVYVVSMTGMAYCLDRRSLSVRWKKLVMSCGDMYSSPVAAGGKLFVGTPGQGMCCLTDDPDADTRPPSPWRGTGGGETRCGAADENGLPGVTGDQAPRRWKDLLFRDRTVSGPVAACGGRLYLQLQYPAGGRAAAEGQEIAPVKLACLDADTGGELWSRDVGGPVTALAASHQAVWVLSGSNSREQVLRRLQASDGAEEWKTPAAHLGGCLTLSGDRLLLAGRDGLVCISASDQQELWRAELPEVVGSPVMAEGLVIALAGGERPAAVCLEDRSGRRIWQSDLPALPVGPPACAGGFVTVASATRGDMPEIKGHLLCLRLVDGTRLWKADLPGLPVGYPVMDDRYTVVASDDGRLYAFETDATTAASLPAAPEEVKHPDEAEGEAQGGSRAALEEAYGKYLDAKVVWWNEVRRIKAEGTFAPRPVRAGGYEVGGSPQPPALVGGVVAYAGFQRMGVWNLAANTWPWQFYERKLMGNVLSPPVAMGETVYLVTDKRGLVAVGEHRLITMLKGLKGLKVGRDDSWRLVEGLRTEKALRAATADEIAKCLEGNAELAARLHAELHKDDESRKKEAGK